MAHSGLSGLSGLSGIFGAVVIPVPTCSLTTDEGNNPTIDEGEDILLTWTSANATTITINGVAKAASGSMSVSPTTTTAYTLAVSNTSGSASSVQTITVVPLPVTVSMPILATADDAYLQRTGTAYPPENATGLTDNTFVISIMKHSTLFIVRTGILRWDRGVIPTGSGRVTAGTLTLAVSLKASADARSLQAEWYTLATPGTISTADYTPTAAGTAGTWTIASLTAGVDNVLALNVAGFPTTGEIGIRLHITGGAASGENNVEFADYSHTTLVEPRLGLTYQP